MVDLSEPLVEAEGHLVIRPILGIGDEIVGAKLVKLTLHPPVLRAGDISVKLRVRVPLRKFKPEPVVAQIDDHEPIVEAEASAEEEEE